MKYSLTELGGGKFCKRSVDSRHNGGDYHYGTSGANASIVSAGLTFWNDWGKNQSPQEKIVTNDQSLVWGGLFEVPASTVWKDNKGHKEHRDGEDVDFPYKVCENGNQINIDPGDPEWDELKEAVNDHFVTCLEENDTNHFHCRD